MKQWNGLLKKEWVTMKWPLLVSALLGIIVMSFVPHLITTFWDRKYMFLNSHLLSVLFGRVQVC